MASFYLLHHPALGPVDTQAITLYGHGVNVYGLARETAGINDTAMSATKRTFRIEIASQ